MSDPQGRTPTHGPGKAPSALSGLESVVAALTMAAAACGALVVLVMLAVIGYSVFMRYFLGTPVTWTDELSGYLVVATVMLGTGEALRRGDHIAVDLVTSKLQARGRRLVDVWANLAVIAVAVTLLISTRETLSYSYNFDILSTGYLEVPMWIPQSILVVGGVLLVLAAVLKILQTLFAPTRQ